MGNALTVPPRSTLGLDAEGKRGRVGDEEDFPIFTWPFRAKNEGRIGEVPEAQPLPLVAYFDAHSQQPGCPHLGISRNNRQTEGACMFILRQVWGKWVSGETVLGRHLRARDGASTFISPILQMKNQTQRSHLLKIIW